jgi:acyl-coenzyme A thioesterase 9
VTAAVDAIHLHKRLRLDADMVAAGQVAWTGSSSMDIRMELLQARAHMHAQLHDLGESKA